MNTMEVKRAAELVDRLDSVNRALRVVDADARCPGVLAVGACASAVNYPTSVTLGRQDVLSVLNMLKSSMTTELLTLGVVV